MQEKPIYLTGFMGSGKTTLGRLLARSLGREFIDLDRFIEDQNNANIPEIFSRQGEERFRELERLAIHETINKKNAIIATGGGAPCFFDNMDVMNKNGITIYLKLSPEALLQRLLPARNHRPLIKDKNEDELHAFIKTKLEAREPYYKKAHLIADTSALTPEETIRIVIMTMQLDHE